MAWPGTLTAEEQEIVQTDVNELRNATLRHVQALNRCIGMNEEYTNRLSALLTKISTDDIIPNTSGLAGSEAITKGELVTVFGWFASLLTDFNTAIRRTGYAQLIGTPNMIRD